MLGVLQSLFLLTSCLVYLCLLLFEISVKVLTYLKVVLLLLLLIIFQSAPTHLVHTIILQDHFYSLQNPISIICSYT